MSKRIIRVIGKRAICLPSTNNSFYVEGIEYIRRELIFQNVKYFEVLDWHATLVFVACNIKCLRKVAAVLFVYRRSNEEVARCLVRYRIASRDLITNVRIRDRFFINKKVSAYVINARY